MRKNNMKNISFKTVKIWDSFIDRYWNRMIKRIVTGKSKEHIEGEANFLASPKILPWNRYESIEEFNYWTQNIIWKIIK